jgi:hypothetical protein
MNTTQVSSRLAMVLTLGIRSHILVELLALLGPQVLKVSREFRVLRVSRVTLV